MDFNTFVQGALRVESDYQAFSEWTTNRRNILPGTDSRQDVRLFHGTLGLVTELLELNDNFSPGKEFLPMNVVNIKEELGDIMWYIAILNEALKSHCDLQIIFAKQRAPGWTGEEKSPRRLTADMMSSVGHMTDCCKRFFFYGREFELQKYVNEFMRLSFLISDLATALGLTIEEIMLTNTAKLAKRYPDKFAKDRAYDRDLAAELQVLSAN